MGAYRLDSSEDCYPLQCRLRRQFQKERHLVASDEDICYNGSVTEAGKVNCRLMQSPCTSKYG
jgi:hypothetical protein